MNGPSLCERLKVEVKDQGNLPSADFSGTERERERDKEEKEHGETIKGPTP